ncbi:hypothetical protein M153_100064110 [Pseudoloma neurophilia]|uniref:Uncharacterized protein n=1 Tax=Pseudoloma neurophilia TaxID=146866 RepID=A0A0R0M1C7_9MICR|nr:hypothetical protein M153_100064110 [Pseudoloma neurophilia]
MKFSLLKLFIWSTLIRSVIFRTSNEKPETSEPFETISFDNTDYLFYLVMNTPIKIKYLQLHLPFIIERLLNLKDTIFYTTGNTKYFIKPFKEIFMIKNGKKILIGKYKNSKNENETLTQKFTNGDILSYGKKIRWSATVKYSGGVEKLKVSRIIEGSLGKYDIRVTGSLFTNKLSHKYTIVCVENKKDFEEDSSEEENDERICKEFERNQDMWVKKLEEYSKMY